VIRKLLYHNNYSIVTHVALCVIICLLFAILVFKFDVFPIYVFTRLIDMQIVMLSSTIAGFELAAVSLLLSMPGNKKWKALIRVRGDLMMFRILLRSSYYLVVSSVLMVFDIYILANIMKYKTFQTAIQVISIFLLILGLSLFLSGLRALIALLVSNKE